VTALTTGVNTSEVPPIFTGRDGSLVPHDEHAGRLLGILAGLESICTPIESQREVSDADLAGIHDPGMIAFLREMAQTAAGERPLFPDSFPRGKRAVPADLRGRFGYYCTDTQTPFIDSYWRDALRAARCALDGAQRLLEGEHLVYAALRPPGHHAGPDYFGGYCYINNTALAADLLSREGRVAVLDVDYHHGNGTQDCFYSTDSVLTVSIHADTRFAYPHFSGAREEIGTGAGHGHNVNLPVPLDTTTEGWFAALDEALEQIARWQPDALVVAFGADTYRHDPVGGLCLDVPDYETLGSRISSLGLPVLAIQEGGYAVDALPGIIAALIVGLRNR
jgi:acetoin utilization deacetylase AcuC-like enzyme